MKKRWLYPAVHVLFWALLLVNSVTANMPPDAYDAQAIKASGFPPLLYLIIRDGGFLAISMTAFYGGYFLIGYSLFPRRRYFLAFLGLLGVCVAMVTVRFSVEYGINKPFLHFDNYFGRPFNLWFYSKNCLGYSYNFCLFGVILFFLVHTGRVERERVSAELAFLKSQVNPHFLFNTINDIYSLVYQKSEQAPEALLKLSGILRYSLYGESSDQVNLGRELSYLSDYLDLQRIGSKQHTYIDFRIEGDTDHLRIAPLLLIPFAENIIKHGIIDDPGNPASLHVRARDGRFDLSAVNRVKEQQKDTSGGIGLINVRRRLELLYPGQHRFEVLEDAGQFRCMLHLTLKTT